MSGHCIESEDFVIVVDKWDASFLRRPGCKPHYFFLTHLHADHIKGLTSTWSRLIYTSPFNAWLLPMRRNVKPMLLKELDLNVTHTIRKSNDGIAFQVTLLDANHCPGAVMFLFQGKFGNILYTGDFRYSPQLLDNPVMSPIIRNKEISVLYLDNTYAAATCNFPPREKALQEVLKIVDEHPDSKILIGMRQLGKEEVLRAIALHVNERVCVSSQRLQILSKLEYEDVFTIDTSQSRIHAVELHTITQKHSQEASKVVSIKLTSMYECMNVDRQRGNIYVVPYSDHSSHSELMEFISHLRPLKLYPIVQPKVPRMSGDSGVWYRMSTVNCVLPEEIWQFCGPAADGVAAPRTAENVSPDLPPLVIKFHPAPKSADVEKKSTYIDEGLNILPFDSLGSQLTNNNKARKHIKASWTRLAPKILSQKGIKFNSPEKMPEGQEHYLKDQDLGQPSNDTQGLKAKADIILGLPESKRNCMSENEGSLLEVPLSDGDDDLDMPSSARELGLRLQLPSNGPIVNGGAEDRKSECSSELTVGSLKTDIMEEISITGRTTRSSARAKNSSKRAGESSLNNSKDSYSDYSSTKRTTRSKGSVSPSQSLGRPRTRLSLESRMDGLVHTEASKTKLVRKSPRDSHTAVSKTPCPTVRKNGLGWKSDSLESLSTKSAPKESVSKKSDKNYVKGGTNKTSNIKEGPGNKINKSAVDICTKVVKVEPVDQGNAFNNIESNETLLTKEESSISGSQNNECSAPIEELSTSQESKNDPSEASAPKKHILNGHMLVSGINGIHINSPGRKRLPISCDWEAAQEIVRKETEQALKALESLNQMKGFKTRSVGNRSGLVALRRLSADNIPSKPSVKSQTFVFTPPPPTALRSRTATILSSMADTFSKPSVSPPTKQADASSKPSVPSATKQSDSSSKPSVSSATKQADTSSKPSVSSATKQADTSSKPSVSSATKQTNTSSKQSVSSHPQQENRFSKPAVSPRTKRADTFSKPSVSSASKQADAFSKPSVSSLSKQSADTPPISLSKEVTKSRSKKHKQENIVIVEDNKHETTHREKQKFSISEETQNYSYKSAVEEEKNEKTSDQLSNQFVEGISSIEALSQTDVAVTLHDEEPRLCEPQVVIKESNSPAKIEDGSLSKSAVSEKIRESVMKSLESNISGEDSGKSLDVLNQGLFLTDETLASSSNKSKTVQKPTRRSYPKKLNDLNVDLIRLKVGFAMTGKGSKRQSLPSRLTSFKRDVSNRLGHGSSPFQSKEKVQDWRKKISLTLRKSPQRRYRYKSPNKLRESAKRTLATILRSGKSLNKSQGYHADVEDCTQLTQDSEPLASQDNSGYYADEESCTPPTNINGGKTPQYILSTNPDSSMIRRSDSSSLSITPEDSKVGILNEVRRSSRISKEDTQNSSCDNQQNSPKRLVTKGPSPKDKNSELSRELAVSPDKCGDSQLRKIDDELSPIPKCADNQVSPKGDISPASRFSNRLSEKTKMILNKGSSNMPGPKSPDLLSLMADAFKKAIPPPTPVTANILSSMAENFKKLDDGTQISPSLSIQLVPAKPRPRSKDKNQADWGVQITRVQSSASRQSSFDSVNAALEKLPAMKNIPKSLSIEIISDDDTRDPTRAKGPSPPTVSICPEVVDLTEDSAQVMSTQSSIRSIPVPPGPRQLPQGATRWPVRKSERNLVQPPPQAVWKEKRSSTQSSDKVIIDIQTQEDPQQVAHCPVHCTCGASTRHGTCMGTMRNLIEEDADCLYEVPLSPEDFENCGAMIALTRGWIESCFEDPEDREEFFQSYEDVLPTIKSSVKQSKSKPAFTKGSRQILNQPVRQSTQSISRNSRPPAPTIQEVAHSSKHNILPTSLKKPSTSTQHRSQDAAQTNKSKEQSKEPSKRSSTDSERSVTLLKEIEKKIKAYNDKQSKKDSPGTKPPSRRSSSQSASSSVSVPKSKSSKRSLSPTPAKSKPKKHRIELNKEAKKSSAEVRKRKNSSVSPSSSVDSSENKKARNLELERLADTGNKQVNKRYRYSVRRSLHHLLTHQKLRSKRVSGSSRV